MTAYEYMQKTLRGIAGGVAWAEHTFTKAPRHRPEELIDVAVDIAWQRLLPRTAPRPDLVIERRGSLIVFRLH